MFVIRNGVQCKKAFQSQIQLLNKPRFGIYRRIHKNSDNEKRMSIPTAGAVGGLAGMLGSLCGVGGGIVMIPAMKHFTKLTVHEITSTSLFAVTLSASFGAYAYVASDVADIPAAIALASTSAIGAGVGAGFNGKLSPKVMSRGLACIMFLGIPAVLYRTTLEDSASRPVKGDGIKKLVDNFNYVLTLDIQSIGRGIAKYSMENYNFLVTGLLTGLASGAFGIGGGIVMTTLLASWPGHEMPQHTAVATSLVVMVPTGLSASIVNVINGRVHISSGIVLAISGATCMYATANYIAPMLDEAKMRYIFSGVMGLSAIRMLL